MQALKRSSSGVDIDITQSIKRSKLEDETSVADAFATANARISDLEQQVKDLHAFINAAGLTWSTSAGLQHPTNISKSD